MFSIIVLRFDAPGPPFENHASTLSITRLIRSCSGSGATFRPAFLIELNWALLPTAGAQVFLSLCRHRSRSFSCQPHLVMHRQDFHAEDADLVLGSQSPVRMHVNVEPLVQLGDVTY